MTSFKSSLVSILLFGAASTAFASDADFKLINKTGYLIDEVYVGPHSSNDWGKDLLGGQAFSDGTTLSITFPHGGSACHFDIQVKYHDDGSTATWNNVNLCEYEKISLFWDDKKQVTRAVGE